MEHNSHLHFLERLNVATAAGYSERLHVFPSGIVLSMPSKKVYHVDELSETEKEDSCALCESSLSYVTVKDGKKGFIFQYFDHYLIGRYQ